MNALTSAMALMLTAGPLTDVPHVSVVYSLEETISKMDRESERTAPVESKGARKALVWVSAGVVEGRWLRELLEVTVPAAEWSALLRQKTVPVATLREREAALSNWFDSDLRNLDVASPGSVRAPIDAEGLILPSVLPALAAKKAAAGDTWSGAVDVSVGAGAFRVPYQVVALSRTAKTLRMRIELAGKPISSSVRNDIVLTLTPRGQWVTEVLLADGLPARIDGELELAIEAHLKTTERTAEVEVYRRHRTFSLARTTLHVVE